MTSTALATTDPAHLTGYHAFNWKDPDYVGELERRLRRLAWLRRDDPANDNGEPGKTSKEKLAALIAYYREAPADFINDWGMTFDPRNADIGLPTTVPFKLFPKQREFIDYVLRKWRNREPGLAEKSRDMGISWLAVSLGATLCLFRDGLAIGYGSRVEDLVDQIGNPDSMFWKARFFLKNLPPEFRLGWTDKDSAHMRISFPATGSVMAGDAGDDIGRGGRSSIYFVDESASLARPMLVEASLSQTTNCRIDISTPKGMANPFAQKRWGGKIEVFTFHWRDDPRKDEAWYAKQVDELDPVTLAQEVDLNYNASATGILIPAAWAQAAVGAHTKLGFAPTGRKRGALDIADEGIDLNALAIGHGVLVQSVTAWSGKGSDIFYTIQRAFGMCDEADVDIFDYDADGLGAGARGDARVINAARKEEGRPTIEVLPFRGSSTTLFEPDKPIPTAVQQAPGEGKDKKERTNKDFFYNMKAQAWWHVRVRFQRTFRAIELAKAGLPHPYSVDDLISLDPDMPELGKLLMELSQPTYTPNTIGKIVVDKAPEGTRSPNHADAVMIYFAPRKAGSWLDAYGKR